MMNLTPTTIKAAAKYLAREFHFSASEIDTLTGLLGRLYHNLLVSVGEESPFDTTKINRLGPETEA